MFARSSFVSAVLVGALLVVTRSAGPIDPAVAATSVAAAPAARTQVSTRNEQSDVSVTVYNSEIALVRDVRQIGLPSGDVELEFQDIAATVNPATVHFRSLSEPSRVSVLEQNYEYDLLEPDKLLRKYVGRDVTLIRHRQENGASIDEEVRARLLSYNTAPVWQIDGEIVTGLPVDHVKFPELPPNLHAKPTLIWSLANEGGQRHRVEVSYLAGQLDWNADYVLTVARDDRTADLDGWVTIKNGSGTTFNNASLQLVAGDLNRVRELTKAMMADAAGAAVARMAAPMAQETFSDYHLYTVGRKTTINNSETKQISMLSGTGFGVMKRYVVNGQPYYFRSATPGASTRTPVEIFYEWKNEAGTGLGMPMPAGTVRVYQADSKGGLQFVGEDRIDHTPKDEMLKLRIGHAFDITAERKQTDFQRVSDRIFESEYEITLRNHKATPVTIELNEPIGGDWDVLRSTHRWTKTAAFALQIAAPVPTDGEVKVRYRVRTRY